MDKGFVGVGKARIIEFPKVSDPRGSLTFIEETRHIPMSIKRVYYLYDLPGGTSRGGHAHKDLEQVIIAPAGSIDVIIDDGINKKTVILNRSYYGLYLPKMIWRELTNFSPGSVCLVLASRYYEENDYYREYSAFLSDAKKGT